MEFFIKEISYIFTLLTNWKGLYLIWPEPKQKDVLRQFDFVDKLYLETQNPRRDNSCLSVRAGLSYSGPYLLVYLKHRSSR